MEKSVSEATKETVAKREVATRGPMAETLLLVQDIKAGVMGPLAMDRATTRHTKSIQLKFLKKCILF